MSYKISHSINSNHVWCLDGSVNLMSSNDWKLDQKGGPRTHPKQQYPFPQGHSFSLKVLRPQEVHKH